MNGNENGRGRRGKRKKKEERRREERGEEGGEGRRNFEKGKHAYSFVQSVGKRGEDRDQLSKLCAWGVLAESSIMRVSPNLIGEWGHFISKQIPFSPAAPNNIRFDQFQLYYPWH